MPAVNQFSPMMTQSTFAASQLRAQAMPLASVRPNFAGTIPQLTPVSPLLSPDRFTIRPPFFAPATPTTVATSESPGRSNLELGLIAGGIGLGTTAVGVGIGALLAGGVGAAVGAGIGLIGAAGILAYLAYRNLPH